jgi:glycosyltransferase involved in cell wall biosynthesis
MKERAASFCTLFPGYKDLHFYKDPGQIPYRLSLRGYDSRIVCFGKSGDFPVTGKHLRVDPLPDRCLSRKFNAGLILYLLKNSGKIDILNLFHYSWSSLLSAFIYKIVNRSGFVYLKIDDCVFAREGINAAVRDIDFLSLKGSGMKGRFKSHIASRFFTTKVDLWSIEDEKSREILEARYSFCKGKLITVYNGHTADLHGAPEYPGLSDKENIIVTAGRLGSFQKAVEVVLDAYTKVAEVSDYNLHLAGPSTPQFRTDLEKYLNDNPSLINRVFYHGALSRDDLYRLFNRSRILCLPSRFEGLAIVYPEAMYYGNVVVTTGHVALVPVIETYSTGLAVDRDDSSGLVQAILKLIFNPVQMDQMAEKAHIVSSAIFNWESIINGLVASIEQRNKYL